MIVAKHKDYAKIWEMVRPYGKIMVLGCHTCVTVCSEGGAKQVGLLATSLGLAAQRAGQALDIVEHTLERQCDPEYVAQLKDHLDGVEAICSIGCGAGVQFVAEHYELPVVPGLDTLFIGVTEEAGTWVERCQACGDCRLAFTGGICPVARCAKSLMNGPCGGSAQGHCEINDDTPCGWQLIVERLETLGELEKYEEILDEPDWSKSRDGGPRRMIREELK